MVLPPAEIQRLRLLCAAFLGAALLCVTAYAAWGPDLIEAMYRGEASAPLNALMERFRRAYPDRGLEFWRGRAGRTLLTRALCLVSLAWLAALLAALPTWRDALRQRVSAFFREPSGALDLAVARFAVFSLLAAGPAPLELARLASLPELLDPPIGFGWVLALLPPTPALVARSAELLRGACALAALGLWTRITAPLAVLLGAYVLGVPSFFGKVGHGDHILLWFAAVLAVSPCADRLALDALWRAWRHPAARVRPRPSPRYGVPIRLLWLLLGLVYFFPGFWKLFRVGVDWFASDNLINVMHFKWFEFEGWRPPLRPDAFPLLVKLGALGTVVFELGFVVAVFSRSWRPVFALAGIGFHTATRIFLAIDFSHLLYAYVVLVPWEQLLARLGVGGPPPGSAPGDRAGPARPGGDRAGPARPGGERPGPAVWAVGACLLAGNAAFGLGRLERGWPLACYPTFAYYTADRDDYVSFRIEGPDGTLRELDRRALRQGLGLRPGVFHMNAHSIARERVPDRAAERAERWLQALTSRGLALEAGSRITCFHDTFSLDPERPEAPLERRVVARFVYTTSGRLERLD